MVEIRTIATPLTSSEAGNRLIGYAAIYNSPTRIRDSNGQEFTEVIRPNAFKLDGLDLKCFYNHDRNEILGRVSSGTLKVWTDARGLAFDVTLPEYAKGKIVELCSRGDLKGCSFAFDPSLTQDRWSVVDNKPFRELMQIAIDEVSIVVDPAYQSTSVSVRSEMPEAPKPNLDYWEKRLHTISLD